MELELPDQMWDMYLTAVAETPPELLINGHKPTTGEPYEDEEEREAEPHGEAYC